MQVIYWEFERYRNQQDSELLFSGPKLGAQRTKRYGITTNQLLLALLHGITIYDELWRKNWTTSSFVLSDLRAGIHYHSLHSILSSNSSSTSKHAHIDNEQPLSLLIRVIVKDEGLRLGFEWLQQCYRKSRFYRLYDDRLGEEDILRAGWRNDWKIVLPLRRSRWSSCLYS